MGELDTGIAIFIHYQRISEVYVEAFSLSAIPSDGEYLPLPLYRVKSAMIERSVVSISNPHQGKTGNSGN